MEALELFKESLDWLEKNYNNYKFFTERDIVWTIQNYLIYEIAKRNLHYRVFNDWPILAGEKRSLCADIVIKKNDNIEIAAEFKYEPNHTRKDFPESKLKQPVVFWGGKSNEHSVEQDIKRAEKFVKSGKAKKGFSIFIDEGGFFRGKEPHPGSHWEDWGNIAVLIFRIE